MADDIAAAPITLPGPTEDQKAYLASLPIEPIALDDPRMKQVIGGPQRLRTVRDLAAAGERVEMAALRTKEGIIYSLPRPGRHHDVIADMRRQGVSVEIICECEQGFLSTGGTWLRRPPAMRLAELAGQLVAGQTIRRDQLFSEDVS